MSKEFLCDENGILLQYNGTRSEVIIPDGITVIGGSAFRGCTSLTSVTIPNSVTSIGDYAFYNCPSLTEVSIPESVTEIGEYAFGHSSDEDSGD